jgi:hypothetical protein
MDFLKKYSSVFLLLVFTWVVLPPSFVHEVFGDHTDTECLPAHDHLTAQLEGKHRHCDVFQVLTPVYKAPELVVFQKPVRLLLEEISIYDQAPHRSSYLVHLKSRGPPVS